MSFREESGGEDGGWSSSASDMRKSFLHTGSCYKMSAAAGMGSRQSSLMERLGSSAYSLHDGSVSAVLCTLIVALGPIQFGFTCGYSSPTQDAIISHLGHARAFGLLCSMLHVLHLFNLLLNWFVQDCSFLFMGRLLEGFGVGVISYTVPVYIAEIAPQNMRGALGSVNQLFVTIGILLASLLGMFVPWRILAVLAILYVFINSSSRDLSSLESALRRGDI